MGETIWSGARAAAATGCVAIFVMGQALAPAMAQDIDGMDGADEDGPSREFVTPQTARRSVIDEVTVTARKVEESLKDVPLSITAFDSNMIEAAGITELGDVADLTPGLTFFNPIGENLPVPVIRGIAPTDIFGETNAGVFVDGVYISGREGLNFSQLDVERIEVVKGPQSAMYGRTAFSGAINYVTKRPSEEFESRVEVEAGNREKTKGSIMVSGPLFTQAVRGRISALYDSWEGSYNNSNHPETTIGGKTLRSFQGGLVWDVTDNLEIYGQFYKSNDEIDDSAFVGISTNCENKVDDDPADTRLLSYCGGVPSLKQVPSPGPGLIDQNSLPKVARALGEDRDLFRTNLNINWDLDFGTFTALTGYTNTQQNSLSDFGRIGDYMPYLYCTGATIDPPGSPNSCGPNPANQQFFSGVLDQEFGSEVKEISQELRFTSAQDQRFRYSFGAYGYRSKLTAYNGGIINTTGLPAADVGLPPFDPSAPNFAIGTAIFYCGFTDDGCLDPLNRPIQDTKTDSWAVFTGIDFDFTDRLTGRFELRYSRQHEEIDQYVYTLCDPTGDTATCGDDWWDLRFPNAIPFNPNDIDNSSASGSANFSAITGRAGLDFRINDLWMIYSSISTGTKPGGVQLRSPNVVTPGGVQSESITSTFDPEKITAYEFGLKGRTEDQRLGLDVAVYYNDWRDIVLRQLVTTSPKSGLPFEQPQAFNVNAGSADVWGWEATADARFTNNLIGRITLGWTDATLTDAAQDIYEDYPSFAPTGDVSGNQLLRQPEWMGSVSLDYSRPISNEWEAFARIDANYQDKLYVGNDNQSWLPARTTANLRFGADSGRVAVTVWVRNLFNNDKASGAFRDIFWSNTDSVTPPFQDLGPRPSFEKFPPLRLTASYPSLRTYGVQVIARFGGAAR